MPYRHVLLLLVLPVLGACAEFPELSGATPVSALAVAPELVPLDGLIAQASGGQLTETTGTALAARASRLRARAALMRGPVTEPQTRARLEAAIAAGQA